MSLFKKFRVGDTVKVTAIFIFSEKALFTVTGHESDTRVAVVDSFGNKGWVAIDHLILVKSIEFKTTLEAILK